MNHLKSIVCLLGAAGILLCQEVSAAIITQVANTTATDAGGWLTASAWSDGQVPAATNDYVSSTSGWDLRSPAAASPIFLGNSLTITNGARLKIKHSGVCTITNLSIWAGGKYINGGASGSTAGNLALKGAGTITFDAEASGRAQIISSLVTADATIASIDIVCTASGGFTPATTGFTFSNPANTFAGTWNVLGGYLKGTGFGAGSFNVGTNGILDFDAGFSSTNSVLMITNGGKLVLDQNVVVYSATIWGQTLAAGTYTGAELKTNALFGAAFDAASLNASTLTVTLGAAPPPAPTPVITQTVSHGATTTLGWLDPATWSDGLAPVATNDYLNNTSGMQTRPPQSSNPVFPGKSLTLTNGAEFWTRHSGTATVSDFRLAGGGKIGVVSGTALAGNLALTGTGIVVFDAGASNRKLTINSRMTAASTLGAIQILAGTAILDASTVKTTGFTFTDANNTFSGTWDVQKGFLKGSGLGSGSFKVGASGFLDFDANFSGSNSDLTILTGGKLLLDQNVTVLTANVFGNVIYAGTYTGAQLKTNVVYGAAFDSSSLNSSTLTVLAPYAASSITWVGPNDGQWTTAANWNLNRLPSYLDQINIPFDHTVLVNGDVILDGGSLNYGLTAGTHALTFTNGADFTIKNSATVNLVSALSLANSGAAGNPTTWEMIGSSNAVSADRIYTDTNTAIRFTADAQGVSPVTVADRLYLRPGSSLIVDLTGYDIGNGTNLVLFNAGAAAANTGEFITNFSSVTFLGNYSAALVGMDSATLRVSLVKPSMNPVPEGGIGAQTFTEAWAGYDPTVEPLNVEIVRQWTEGPITLRVIRYDIGTFATPFGGTQVSKMAAFYGFPTGSNNLPAILHIHGGGQTASLDEVRYAAYNGYAGLSVNWLGNTLEGAAPGEPNTEWGSVDARQVYHQDTFITVEPDSRTIDRVRSVRNSNWFLLAIANRRGLTFLQQQPEVNPVKLAVTGYSMGGEQATYLAGSDARLLAAAPSVGGDGDMTAADVAATGLPGFVVDTSHDAQSRQARASGSMPYTTTPILYYGPLNDHNAPSDNLMYHYEHLIPTNTPKRFAMPPHLDHANLVENEISAMLWFDQYLKGDYQMPAQPSVSVNLTGSGGPTVTVTADTAKPIVKVVVLYSVDPLPVTRFWRAAPDVHPTAPGIWQATCKNIVQGQPLFVVANVFYDHDYTNHTVVARGQTTPYTGDFLLTSNLKQIPAPDMMNAGTWFVASGRKMLVDDFRRGWDDWKQNNWTSSSSWSAYSLKPIDPLYTGNDGALLALDVKSSSTKTLLLGVVINDWQSKNSGSSYTYYVAKTVGGSSNWQTITAAASEFRSTDATAPALTNWTQVSGVKLQSGSVTVYNPNGTSANLSASSWTTAERQFGLLRWQTSENTWLSSYGLLPADALLDKDGDGMVCRYEYAFDLNPKTPDGGDFNPISLNPSGYLQAQYNELNTNLVYGVQVASNLVNSGWTNTGVVFSKDAVGGTVATDGAGSSTGADQRFMRMRVQLVP